MTALKLLLLGSPHVTVDEKSVIVESRKALAILAYLAVTNQRQGRDWLATLFWPEQDQSRARASLRQVLWLMRNAGLEPWLLVDQDALELQGAYWCDVHHFQAAIHAHQIDAALALYRDHLLAGFSLRDCPEFDQWHFLHADELRRQLASALEECVVRCRDAGEYEQGLQYARRWLALDSLHEPTHRYLMQLYAYAGQHAAALRQFEECVRLLEEELDVVPEDETVALYQAIKTRQLAPVVKARPPVQAAMTTAHALLSAVAPAHNLPLHLTPFVGREAELDALAKIVADAECRLVSIIGPGGIGKTRLAVQVARRLLDAPANETTPTSLAAHLFPQGVRFVDLHAVETTNGIIAAIAEAVGLVFYNNEAMRQQLLDFLHARKVLLMLDNFEHLLASADLMVDLLTHAPNLTLLVTSREALNLQGEWLWSLGGLDVPEVAGAEDNAAEYKVVKDKIHEDKIDEDRLLESAAVRMFVQSARRIQPHFSLAAEATHIVQICRMLGGMPLAIELAVAWLRVIPCAQVAREIARDLDFLTTRLRDVPDRHRSIQAVFEHSWRLLTPAEQTAFQQVSVFRGGFDLQAAAQVAEASWLDLAALKDKSLLNVNADGRFTVHELLRQYAMGKLEESPAKKDATLARFCTYFADFLHQRELILKGPTQLQIGAEITTEFDNIRAAWQWSLQQNRFEEISRSASAFYFFCQFQSRYLEGAKSLQDAQLLLETCEPSPQRDRSMAQIYSHLGWLCIRMGEFERAVRVLQRSRELYAQLDEPQRILDGDPLIPLAIVRHIQGVYHGALELATASLPLAAVQSDKHNLAVAHYALTSSYLALGDFERARQHVEAALLAAREVGNRWFLPYILNESGKVARALGNYAEAKSLFQQSYYIKREFSDPEGMAVALNHLGEIAYLQADYAKAHQFYTEANEIYGEINDRGGLAASARGLGQVACAQPNLHAAKVWFEQALKIALEIRYWPLIYALLLDVGHLFMQTGAHALAMEAVALVQQQPASDFETKARARQQMEQWQSHLAVAQVDANPQPGAGGDADALLQRVLAEISKAS